MFSISCLYLIEVLHYSHCEYEHFFYFPPGVWHDTMDRIRVSCRKTSTAALPHSQDTGCGQSHTSNCRSPDTSRPHLGLPGGSTRTPSRNDPHIPGGTARNNRRRPGKTPSVLDDVASDYLSLFYNSAKYSRFHGSTNPKTPFKFLQFES